MLENRYIESYTLGESADGAQKLINLGHICRYESDQHELVWFKENRFMPTSASVKKRGFQGGGARKFFISWKTVGLIYFSMDLIFSSSLQFFEIRLMEGFKFNHR